MAKRYDIEVIGMTCSSCSGRVERSLKKHPGIVSAEVDHQSGLAVVEAIDSVSREDIERMVLSTGFELK